MCSCETRYSVTPSTSPISRSVSSTKRFLQFRSSIGSRRHCRQTAKCVGSRRPVRRPTRTSTQHGPSDRCACWPLPAGWRSSTCRDGRPIPLFRSASVSGTGNPNSGVWQLERPRVEDAFIEREGDSLSVPRLRDLPELLRLPPSRWPKAALSVVPEDVRCDTAMPKPGDRVRCQATIRNRGSVEALARVTVGIVARYTDIGLGQPLPRSTIRPNDQVVVSWDWVWPKGDAWSVSVWVELHTPHGYGGYRIPIKERNVQDNRAYVRVPSRKSSAEARSVDSMLRIRGGELLAPASAPVAPGRSYPFQVGHCGLLHVVDFSGSYWVVDETTLSAGERGQFGIYANEGTMTLVDSETAVFRSGVGGEVTLRRYVGVLERLRCF